MLRYRLYPLINWASDANCRTILFCNILLVNSNLFNYYNGRIKIDQKHITLFSFIAIREVFKLNIELSQELEKCFCKDSSGISMPLIDAEKLKQLDITSGAKRFKELCNQLFHEAQEYWERKNVFGYHERHVMMYKRSF
jgi:hypothetical protein